MELERMEISLLDDVVHPVGEEIVREPQNVRGRR